MNNSEKMSMEQLHPIIAESVRDGGQFVFYPSGTSMLPTITQGEDCVVLIEAKDIKKFDLVLFRRLDGKYVLHRIIDENNGEYTIRGDNQSWTEKISPIQVIAKVEEIRKKSGKVLAHKHFTMGAYVARIEIVKLAKRAFFKLYRIITGKK